MGKIDQGLSMGADEPGLAVTRRGFLKGSGGTALALMAEYPSLIKRPVIEAGSHIACGFNESRFEQILLSYNV